MLAAVGAHFASSQISDNSESVTGVPEKLFVVRALVNTTFLPPESRRWRMDPSPRTVSLSMFILDSPHGFQ